MALPRNKSREVSVSEERFRYIVSIGEDEDGWFISRITVQCWTGYGSKLFVEDIPRKEFWRDHPKPVKDEIFRLVKPAYIARQIESAIRGGWDHRHCSGQLVVPAVPDEEAKD